ncbi:MAG: transposase [Anaerolineae bacterium]
MGNLVNLVNLVNPVHPPETEGISAYVAGNLSKVRRFEATKALVHKSGQIGRIRGSSTDMKSKKQIQHRQRKQRRKKQKAQKAKYRVRNWPEYDRALVQRGSITLWIAEDALTGWFYQGPPHRGAPFVYSDVAIELVLTVREVYHLPNRAAEGFIRSIFQK